MRKILVILVLMLMFPIFSFAQNPMVGSTVPDFTVKSGDDKELKFDDIKGKMIVLFYETKDTKEKNRKLKDELNKFYNLQPETVKNTIIRLAVINCKGVLFTGAWKSALRENSQKEGITIYGDWDGKMGIAYHVKDKESNVFIIDKKGIIRYHYAGQINDKDISAIENLLNSLTRLLH